MLATLAAVDNGTLITILIVIGIIVGVLAIIYFLRRA
jgi:hypothetical protein